MVLQVRAGGGRRLGGRRVPVADLVPARGRGRGAGHGSAMELRGAGAAAAVSARGCWALKPHASASNLCSPSASSGASVAVEQRGKCRGDEARTAARRSRLFFEQRRPARLEAPSQRVVWRPGWRSVAARPPRRGPRSASASRRACLILGNRSGVNSFPSPNRSE